MTNARLQREEGLPPFVLAMPSDGLWGDGSGYVAHRTQDFERWIVNEVPALVRQTVPAVTAASSWFIAGLSMGGFGALRLGAKYLERFRAIAEHSSITELEQLKPFVIESTGSFSALEGDRSVLDTMLRNRGRLPAIRFDGGTADPLLEANRTLHDGLTRAGWPTSTRSFRADTSGPTGKPIWRTLCDFSPPRSAGRLERVGRTVKDSRE